MDTPREIPEYVIAGLETVRASAVTNMLDRPGVIMALLYRGDGDAAEWIMTNLEDYQRALETMGARVNRSHHDPGY